MSKPGDIYDLLDDQLRKLPEAPESLKQPIRSHIVNGLPDPLHEVRPALNAYPTDPDLLLMAAIAALQEERPDQSLSYQKRYNKHFVATPGSHLLHAIALAQKRLWSQASRIVQQHNLKNVYLVARYLPCGPSLVPWIREWLFRVVRESYSKPVVQRKKPGKSPARAPDKPKPSESGSGVAKTAAATEPDDVTVAGLPVLPQISVQIPIEIDLPKAENIRMEQEDAGEGYAWFRLRNTLAHLTLLQGFDELLCLPQLHDINTYWYQVETVRKVLKQFRGRVLLADEVGLGKTIEAGMVLKEYMLRGMIDRVLVLTPASMVGQWLEEMAAKFDMQFASSYDGLLRNDAQAFWEQPRVIASIATARRADHFEILRRQVYDMVIVDEAHHLKNRATSNWKLVDALQKRFLLLLSATPVQNSLVELYNLLTLLKPGIFKTEKEFRSTYMTSGKPRVPANSDRLRDLMRDVMIRNTRSQVDVRLPPRTAVTLWVEAGAEEAACYEEMGRLARQVHETGDSHRRMALRHLLSSAGSSPAAAAAAIRRFAAGNAGDGEWSNLHERYGKLSTGGKEAALAGLLKRNPDEKKIIFVHHRETLNRLDRLVRAEGVSFSRYDGTMSGPEKDRAIERFRDEVSLLLSTESGGEGRNLQFCNTLINFDLPWNPMAIEQRIGRLHRIGQTRQVFIFNLVVRNTLEEYVLRILDEKINMFELVVGEIGSILGEVEESREFAELVFDAWIETTEQDRPAAFDLLGERMLDAKRKYEAVKVLDEELFGEDFVAS